MENCLELLKNGPVECMRASGVHDDMVSRGLDQRSDIVKVAGGRRIRAVQLWSLRPSTRWRTPDGERTDSDEPGLVRALHRCVNLYERARHESKG